MRLVEYLKLKKKGLIILLSSLFSLVVIFIGTYYVARMRQEAARSKAAGSASLYFDLQSPTVSLNSDFTLKVKINPGSEKVTAVELYLSFDKDRIEVEKIKSTQAFPTVLIAPSIDNNQGRISVVVAILLQEGSPVIPVTEISDLVLVKAKTKGTPGIAFLKISQDSKAAAIGKTSNVIASYGEASVNITSPTNTPTPTPTGGSLVGDVNGDGKVNIIDIGILIDNYGSSPPTDPRADLNKDGIVNIIDIGIVIDNYGS